jgi:hypothetical protein
MQIDDFNYSAGSQVVDEYLGMATPGGISLLA